MERIPSEWPRPAWRAPWINYRIWDLVSGRLKLTLIGHIDQVRGLALSIFQLLSSTISNGAAESILRSRTMMITGRLLSKENAFAFIEESSFRDVLSAIDKRFAFLDGQETDECESALEALGQIGSSMSGANTRTCFLLVMTN